MAIVSNQPWYVGQTYPSWDIPLNTDATTNGTSSTAVAPGSVQITTSAGFCATLTTSTVIVVDAGNSQQETVTPSSVNAGANQFTATFVKSHTGTYTLVANPEDITSVNIANFAMIFRSTAVNPPVDTIGTGTFSVKSLIPAEVYYKPSVADVAAVFNGVLIVRAYFPPSNGVNDTVVYDPTPFSLTAI